MLHPKAQMKQPLQLQMVDPYVSLAVLQWHWLWLAEIVRSTKGEAASMCIQVKLNLRADTALSLIKCQVAG